MSFDLDDVVGALVEELDVVADDDDDAPLARQVPQLSGDGHEMSVVDTGGGLIQDEDAGVLVDRGGDDEALLLPAAERKRVTVG